MKTFPLNERSLNDIKCYTFDQWITENRKTEGKKLNEQDDKKEVKTIDKATIESINKIPVDPKDYADIASKLKDVSGDITAMMKKVYAACKKAVEGAKTEKEMMDKYITAGDIGRESSRNMQTAIQKKINDLDNLKPDMLDFALSHLNSYISTAYMAGANVALTTKTEEFRPAENGTIENRKRMEDVTTKKYEEELANVSKSLDKVAELIYKVKKFNTSKK